MEEKEYILHEQGCTFFEKIKSVQTDRQVDESDFIGSFPTNVKHPK